MLNETNDASFFDEDQDVNDLAEINTDDLLLPDSMILQHIWDFNSIVENAVEPEHWKKFPHMEVVETKYSFDMDVDPGENQTWLYNVNLKKVYIRQNSTMKVSISYKPLDSTNLHLRAMILYTSPDEMHIGVKRCRHHKKIEEGKVPKSHILKCLHPNTQYVGDAKGQVFGERLALLVPLGRPSVNEDGIARESLTLAFLCQNSCVSGMNRKSTAVVFTLENESREILGKVNMPFKVCSCPKRDMKREDSTFLKRKAEKVSQLPQTKRPMKRLPTDVKEEPTPSPISKTFEQPIIDQDVTIALTMPDASSMQQVLRCAADTISGVIVKDLDNLEKYIPYLREIEGNLSIISE